MAGFLMAKIRIQTILEMTELSNSHAQTTIPMKEICWMHLLGLAGNLHLAGAIL